MAAQHTSGAPASRYEYHIKYDPNPWQNRTWHPEIGYPLLELVRDQISPILATGFQYMMNGDMPFFFELVDGAQLSADQVAAIQETLIGFFRKANQEVDVRVVEMEKVVGE